MSPHKSSAKLTHRSNRLLGAGIVVLVFTIMSIVLSALHVHGAVPPWVNWGYRLLGFIIGLLLVIVGLLVRADAKLAAANE